MNTVITNDIPIIFTNRSSALHESVFLWTRSNIFFSCPFLSLKKFTIGESIVSLVSAYDLNTFTFDNRLTDFSLRPFSTRLPPLSSFRKFFQVRVISPTPFQKLSYHFSVTPTFIQKPSHPLSDTETSRMIPL